MNQKQFITLIILGLIVGGIGLSLYNKRKESFTASSFEKDKRVIEKFPLNDVAHVRVKQTTNEVNLVRADEGWTVKERYGYPANFSEVSEFLRKTWELKPVQDVEAGASQYGRLNLLNPAQDQSTNAGTLVEFKDGKGSNLKSMVLGKKATKESQAGPFGGGGEFPVGRYVLVPENPPKVWLVSETFANIETKPEQWLNRDFIKVEKVKSVDVSSPNASNTWSVARETESGEWKMANLSGEEKFDNSKASSLNYLLSSPSFNDVASPETKIEETNQLATAKIETFEGFVYNVKIGGKTNEDNLLMNVNVTGTFTKERTPGKEEKPEDKEKLDKEFKDKLEKLQEKLKNEQKYGKWTYQVSKWTVDSLLKPRKDFMSEKKDEPAKATGDTNTPPTAPPIETVPPELKNLLPPGAARE